MDPPAARQTIWDVDRRILELESEMCDLTVCISIGFLSKFLKISKFSKFKSFSARQNMRQWSFRHNELIKHDGRQLFVCQINMKLIRHEFCGVISQWVLSEFIKMTKILKNHRNFMFFRDFHKLYLPYGVHTLPGCSTHVPHRF